MFPTPTSEATNRSMNLHEAPQWVKINEQLKVEMVGVDAYSGNGQKTAAHRRIDHSDPLEPVKLAFADLTIQK